MIWNLTVILTWMRAHTSIPSCLARTSELIFYQILTNGRKFRRHLATMCTSLGPNENIIHLVLTDRVSVWGTPLKIHFPASILFGQWSKARIHLLFIFARYQTCFANSFQNFCQALFLIWLQQPIINLIVIFLIG